MGTHLKLGSRASKRDKFGQSSERERHLDQLELQLEELVVSAIKDELAAANAARVPLPLHLRHWKANQTVREKSTCRSCEKIT